MRVFLLCLSCLICLASTSTQATDPLRSAACMQALAALGDVEDALGSKGGAHPQAGGDRRLLRERLVALQQRAASICLGSAEAAASAAPRVPAAPAIGEPVRTAAPIAATPASAASPPPGRTSTPPKALPPPVLSLVSCDAAGCWASDGTRLQRSGGLLLGPRGYCSAVGAVLSCP